MFPSKDNLQAWMTIRLAMVGVAFIVACCINYESAISFFKDGKTLSMLLAAVAGPDAIQMFSKGSNPS